MRSNIYKELQAIKADCSLPDHVRCICAEAWDHILRLEEEVQASRHSEAVDRITIRDLEERIDALRCVSGDQGWP
jgi:type VI protein secretion system component Hcp